MFRERRNCNARFLLGRVGSGSTHSIKSRMWIVAGQVLFGGISGNDIGQSLYQPVFMIDQSDTFTSGQVLVYLNHLNGS